LVAHVKSFYDAFSARAIAIRKIMATDDEVMAWWRAEATHAATSPVSRRLAGRSQLTPLA
jgi:hypothetical protein